ncbi:MAG: hypothetical protein ACRDHY_16720 [Anaerolineales bacterium]
MADTWIVAHVLSVVAFLVVHAVPITTAFLLRRETDEEKVRRLVRISHRSVGITHLTMFLILITGLALAQRGPWWSARWLWAALAVFMGLWAFMWWQGTKHYDKVRAAVGEKLFYPKKGAPPPPRATPEELRRLLRSRHPYLLLLVGGAGFVLLAWLMMAKPF